MTSWKQWHVFTVYFNDAQFGACHRSLWISAICGYIYESSVTYGLMNRWCRNNATWYMNTRPLFFQTPLGLMQWYNDSANISIPWVHHEGTLEALLYYCSLHPQGLRGLEGPIVQIIEITTYIKFLHDVYWNWVAKSIKSSNFSALMLKKRNTSDGSSKLSTLISMWCFFIFFRAFPQLQ